MKIALLIEYDGTDFSGWQIQENGRTVQGVLEQAFKQILQTETAVHGAGRTDAGVHGRGMVAHAVLPEGYTLDKGRLIIGLNATTPFDVVIKDLKEVPGDFHARFSATARQYRYTIRNERTAIDRALVWAIRKGVNVDSLLAATELLVGDHDFTSFSKRSPDVDHYRCIVEEARWDFYGTTFALTIRANRFVRGMVRALVGALVQVGQGLMTVEDFERLLRTPEEYSRAKFMAPPHGLVLEGVQYPSAYGLWQINETTASFSSI